MCVCSGQDVTCAQQSTWFWRYSCIRILCKLYRWGVWGWGPSLELTDVWLRRNGSHNSPALWTCAQGLVIANANVHVQIWPHSKVNKFGNFFWNSKDLVGSGFSIRSISIKFVDKSENFLPKIQIMSSPNFATPPNFLTLLHRYEQKANKQIWDKQARVKRPRHRHVRLTTRERREHTSETTTFLGPRLAPAIIEWPTKKHASSRIGGIPRFQKMKPKSL
jgi:hypothetical protein